MVISNDYTEVVIGSSENTTSNNANIDIYISGVKMTVIDSESVITNGHDNDQSSASDQTFSEESLNGVNKEVSQNTDKDFSQNERPNVFEKSSETEMEIQSEPDKNSSKESIENDYVRASIVMSDDHESDEEDNRSGGSDCEIEENASGTEEEIGSGSEERNTSGSELEHEAEEEREDDNEEGMEVEQEEESEVEHEEESEEEEYDDRTNYRAASSQSNNTNASSDVVEILSSDDEDDNVGGAKNIGQFDGMNDDTSDEDNGIEDPEGVKIGNVVIDYDENESDDVDEEMD